MYESFYGMREKPFALLPDPDFLFLSRKHAMALSMLEYGLTGQAGFSVVTGEVGSGKTTLIRQFLRLVDRSVTAGVISNTHESLGDLLQWVLLAFGVTSDGTDKAQRYRAFVDYLSVKNSAGHRVILIVDEAQNLAVDSLEELRLLSNVNPGKKQLLQMILVGQPELLDKIKRPDLRQFAQRISVHYHLGPLDFAETRDYIRHRLNVASADPTLFEDPAVGCIYHFTGGLPRLINSVCDMALVYGYAEGAKRIGLETVLAVVEDKARGGLLLLDKNASKIDRADLIRSIDRMLSEAPIDAQTSGLGRASRARQPHGPRLSLLAPAAEVAGPQHVSTPQPEGQGRADPNDQAPRAEAAESEPVEPLPAAPPISRPEPTPPAAATERKRHRWVQWLLFFFL